MIIPTFTQNELQIAATNRMSSFNFCNPFDVVLPFTDGALGLADRGHLWGLYVGINIGGFNLIRGVSVNSLV